MLVIKDRHNPSFVLFPINNNRTAWKPFGLPVIVVVPHRRDMNGITINNSDIRNMRIYIEDVPRKALVAGHDHDGLRYPDRELYSKTISRTELTERLVQTTGLTYFNQDGEEATEGTLFFNYTTRSGIYSDIQYFPDADYYDISDFLIENELLPQDLYNLVYEAEYFTRVVTNDEFKEFLCIDASKSSILRLKFQINHPGDVLYQFYKLTPPPYLTDATKSKDSTLDLYRPFTDCLQNIYDEQNLLEKINWVNEAPAEAIPYLSALLGWDIPYFPSSLDSLRRAVLRRTVELQNLSGSRRAIVNIFRMFGFEILITNLWWSSDGKIFIRPGQRLPAPYENEEIKIKPTYQTDLLLCDYNKQGFSELTIPLLFRPQITIGETTFTTIKDGGDVTIESYKVSKDSEAHLKLIEISNNIKQNVLHYSDCYVDASGFINSRSIADAMTGTDVIGFSQIKMSGKIAEVIEETTVGIPPISSNTLKFDRINNSVTFSISDYLTTDIIFSFAYYEKQNLEIPAAIADLQSNRFEIQVLTQDFAEFAEPITLEFAIEFLYRLKAFHSLLNVIRTKIELTETYEVTNWCVGGDTLMRYDVDAGRLQVPPAIIPKIPSELTDCSLLDPQSLGYKDTDILLRLRKLANLPEEHAAWKALDNRDDSTNDGLRLRPMLAVIDRELCRYNNSGQDRIVGTRSETTRQEYNPKPNASQQIRGISENPKLSPVDDLDNGSFDPLGAGASPNSNSSPYSSFTVEHTATYEPHCELNGDDYCYKGRVDDELLCRSTILENEGYQNKPCTIGIGNGTYYTYPALAKVIISGVKNPSSGSKTSRTAFSGGSDSAMRKYFSDNGIQSEYLNAEYDKPLDSINNSFLGQLYRAYGVNSEHTIHYSNRLEINRNQRFNLALQRPSLMIEKPTMHLPGCRFPTMNKLRDDFVHPTVEARPWDRDLCGRKGVCGPDNNYLNFNMTTSDSGDEVMEYDFELFSIRGNGLKPDITSTEYHSFDEEHEFDENDVIHAVYMNGCNDSPYVTFDQCVEPEDNLIVTDDPIFGSHKKCETGGFTDYSDGYRAVFGEFDYSGEDFSTWYDVLNLLGMPFGDNSSMRMVFKFSSGIRDRKQITLRYDCGCSIVDCDNNDTISELCGINNFKGSDGFYDFNPDKIHCELRMKNTETLSSEFLLFNNSIKTMLETL